MGDHIHRELTIPNDATYLSQLRQTVLDLLAQQGVGNDVAHMIILAIDEAVANVIEHGYETTEDKESCKINVVLDLNPKKLEVRIRDTGQPFDPKSVPGDVDLSESVKMGKKGGLGIFLIRRIMDEVQYTYKRGEHNELYMIKFIDNRSAKAKSEQTSRREGAPKRCH